MLNYILSSLIIGSGILLGAILAKITKDELKPGKRYFIIIKKILFSAVILITSGFYTTINPIISVIILLFLCILLIKRFHIILTYTAFAVIYVLSSANQSLFILISSLIFFAGFPIGTLYSKKSLKPILTAYLVFIVIAMLNLCS